MAGSRGGQALGMGLKGAGTGAGIGTALGGPIGGAIGAGVGALAGGIAGAVTGGRSKAERQYDKMIRGDMQALQEGRLGLDRAQRQQLQADASRAQGALLSNQQAQIARAGLAGTDPQAYAEAQRAVAQQGVEGMAKGNAAIADLDARLREERYNRIMRDYGLMTDRAAVRRAEDAATAGEAMNQGALLLAGLNKQGQSQRKAAAEAPPTDAEVLEEINFTPSAPLSDTPANELTERMRRLQREVVDSERSAMGG